MGISVDHRFLTPLEAAACLGIANHQLTYLRATTKGPDWLAIGRTIRYSKADLQWWLEHQSTVAT